MNPDNTESPPSFPPHLMAAAASPPYLAFRAWSDLTAMDSLINTAASQHAIHLGRATKALACEPPRFDLFYFHSAMCNVVVKALDILKERDWTKLGACAPYIPLEDILSSLQSTDGTVSPSETTNKNES